MPQWSEDSPALRIARAIRADFALNVRGWHDLSIQMQAEIVAVALSIVRTAAKTARESADKMPPASKAGGSE